MKKTHFYLIKDHRRVGVLVPTTVGVVLVYAEDPRTLFPDLFRHVDETLGNGVKVVVDEQGTTYTMFEFSEQVIQTCADVVVFPAFAGFK